MDLQEGAHDFVVGVLGTDYSPGIIGTGIKRAAEVFAANPQWTSETPINEVVKAFKLQKASQTLPEAIASVQRAVDAMTHAWALNITPRASRPLRLKVVPTSWSADARKRVDKATGSLAAANAAAFAVSTNFQRVQIPDFGPLGTTAIVSNLDAARAYLAANGVPQADVDGMTTGSAADAVRVFQQEGLFPPKFVADAERTAEAKRRMEACSLEDRVIFKNPSDMQTAQRDCDVAVCSFTDVQRYLSTCQGPLGMVGVPRSIVLGASVYNAGAVGGFMFAYDLASGDQLINATVKTNADLLDGAASASTYEVVLRLRTTPILVGGGHAFTEIGEHYCTCLSGMALCKHVAAVLFQFALFSMLTANKKIDSTSLACTWRRATSTGSMSTVAESRIISNDTAPSLLKALLAEHQGYFFGAKKKTFKNLQAASRALRTSRKERKKKNIANRKAWRVASLTALASRLSLPRGVFGQ